jgi:hypothetical protein
LLGGLVESIAAAQRAILLARLEDNGVRPVPIGALSAEPTLEELRRAGVLADPALIESIYHRLLAHQIETVAQSRLRRETESAHAPGAAADPIAALIEGASPEVVHALTEFLVWRSKRRDGYGHPLLPLDELPAGLAERLCWAVAAAHRALVTRAAALDEAALDDALEAAAQGVLVAAVERRPVETAPERAARLLVDTGSAGPGLLAPLLAHGEVALFESVFARLSGLPPVLVRRFLFEPGGEAIAVCARALDLGRNTLAAILEATRAARQGSRAAAGGDIDAALALHDRLDSETAGALLKRWARPRDYQWALRSLEGPADEGPPARRPR